MLMPAGAMSMDFNDDGAEREFRRTVRDFLDRNLPPGWGTPNHLPPQGDEYAAVAADFQRRLSAAGLLCLAWPLEYGGAGASAAQLAIFNEEMSWRRAPQLPNVAGVMLAGPVIYTFGSAAQKQRYLGPIRHCDETWCQGFSEPGAGSDLAALRTRAELRGDRFVVNGQKVWTSFAHLADWCMLLARTDPHAPRHRGLSLLLVDMKSPGIEFIPLRHLTGAVEFNELFFNDVEVPVQNLVGPLHGGWQAAMATLMNERGGTAIAAAARLQSMFSALAGRLRPANLPEWRSRVMRQQMAQLYTEVQGLRHTARRMLLDFGNSSMRGAAASLVKVMWSELNQRMQELAIALEGPAGQLTEGSDRAIQKGGWQFEFLRSRANTIEMGTSEIHRNTIAERGLGLPRPR
jgi:alkylation response protein AidB-like acyl-CoA dehydrogenase